MGWLKIKAIEWNDLVWFGLFVCEFYFVSSVEKRFDNQQSEKWHFDKLPVGNELMCRPVDKMCPTFAAEWNAFQAKELTMIAKAALG